MIRCLQAIAVMVLTAFFSLAPAQLRAGESAYVLGEGDQLRLIVPNAADLSGLYRLGEGGRIGLPVDADVVVGGLTLAEARRVIIDALAPRMKQPVVGLEIAERRPFFITGDVAKPGAYPYLVGLTLGQAVALAGGPYRFASGEGLQTFATGVRAAEELSGSRFDLALARIRAARTEASLAGRKEFDVPPPPDGVDKAKYDLAAKREQAVMTASIAADASRLDLLTRQLEAKKAEIAALGARVAETESQIAKVDIDIAGAQSRLSEGLSTRDRLDMLQLRKDQLSTGALDSTVLLNQAREVVLSLELDLDDSPRKRMIGLLSEAAATEQRIEQLALSVSASAQVANATGVKPATAGPTIFTITRAGKPLAASSDATISIQPGDLIEVSNALGRD